MDDWTDDELRRLRDALVFRRDLAEATFGNASAEEIRVRRACLVLWRERIRRCGQYASP